MINKFCFTTRRKHSDICTTPDLQNNMLCISKWREWTLFLSDWINRIDYSFHDRINYLCNINNYFYSISYFHQTSHGIYELIYYTYIIHKKPISTKKSEWLFPVEITHPAFFVLCNNLFFSSNQTFKASPANQVMKIDKKLFSLTQWTPK